MRIETEVIPPGLDDDEDGEGRPTIAVFVSLVEGDGTHRGSNVYISATADDAEVVEALIAAARGLAASRGPGLVSALRYRLRERS